uniref:Uncharacterized protein n=1 Tax=Glossina austeni TaxID=7395 RepID=A0A1A9UIY5_GLOAU
MNKLFPLSCVSLRLPELEHMMLEGELNQYRGYGEYAAIDYGFAYKIEPPRFEFFGTVPYNCHDDIFSHSKYVITDQPETCVDSASSRGAVLADITGLSLGGECIRNISRGKIFIERSTMGGVMNDERYSGSISIKPVKPRYLKCVIINPPIKLGSDMESLSLSSDGKL